MLRLYHQGIVVALCSPIPSIRCAIARSRDRLTRAARLPLLTALLALLLTPGCGSRDSETRFDENLFLLHALEDIYARWPVGGSADPGQVANWLARTRTRIAEARAAMQANQLEPELGVLYGHCLEFLDAYQSYLVKQELIDPRTGHREMTDSAWTVLSGMWNSAHAEQTAKRLRSREDDSPWMGPEETGTGRTQAGGDRQAVGDTQAGGENSPQGDVDPQDSASDEKRQLLIAWDALRAEAKAAAGRLSDKHGWAPGEAGFNGFQGSTPEDYAQRRPRDPFAPARLATQRAKADSPEDTLNKAQSSAAAVDLVPPGGIYDPSRADFLQQAASLGLLATTIELQPFSYSSGPARSAPEAVRLCELYLAADPKDSSRAGHVLLSHALAAAGRLEDAVREANVAREQWGRDPVFCYHYARLMSLTRSPDLAGDWLAQAYRVGFNDIEFVRADADLANYRADRPEQFRLLTRVKWSFKIAWGESLDDIIITNESPFELTGVNVDLFIRQGRRTWEPAIRSVSLKPGEIYTAIDVIDVPGNRYDIATGVMFCDQDR